MLLSALEKKRHIPGNSHSRLIDLSQHKMANTERNNDFNKQCIHNT